MFQQLDRCRSGKDTRKDLSDRIGLLDEHLRGQEALKPRFVRSVGVASSVLPVSRSSSRWLSLPPARDIPLSDVTLRDFHLADTRCYIHLVGDSHFDQDLKLRCWFPPKGATVGRCNSSQFVRKDKKELFVFDLDSTFLLVYLRLECQGCNRESSGLCAAFALQH